MLYVSKERQAGYLIDRKFLVRQLKHPVYAELWGAQGDTLLDGELVIREQHAAHHHSGPSAGPGQPLANFMVFDALVVNGARTLEQKLSHRLEQIGRNVVVPYRNKYPPVAATAASAPAAQQPPTTFAAMIAAEAGGVPSNTVAAPPAAPAPVAQPPMSVGAKAFVRKHHLKVRFTVFINCHQFRATCAFAFVLAS
jgi:predicted component of type VI protein secretion system